MATEVLDATAIGTADWSVWLLSATHPHRVVQHGGQCSRRQRRTCRAHMLGLSTNTLSSSSRLAASSRCKARSCCL